MASGSKAMSILLYQFRVGLVRLKSTVASLFRLVGDRFSSARPTKKGPGPQGRDIGGQLQEGLAVLGGDVNR